MYARRSLLALAAIVPMVLSTTALGCPRAPERCGPLQGQAFQDTRTTASLTKAEKEKALEAVTLAQAGVQGFATQLANVLQNGYESEVGHLKGEDAFRRFALDVYLSLREDTSDISEGYIALHDLSKHVAAEGVVQVLGAFAEDMVAPKDSRSLKHRADFSDPAQALQILGKRMAQLNNPDVKSGLRHLGEQAIARQLPQHGYSLTRIADELQLASVAQQVGLGTQFKEASRSGSYGRN